MTEPPLLEIDEVLLRDGERPFRISSMSLARGGTYAAFGKSNTRITDFLYLVGGLQTALEHRMRPINKGLAAKPPDVKGIIQDRVRLNGKALYFMDPVLRAQRVGYIFENPEWGFLCNTVAEDFRFCFFACALKPPPIYRLRDYALFAAQSQTPESLSGGEQQRLSCAAIIERTPELVIADFSSSNLDRQFREEVLMPWITRVGDNTTFVIRGLPLSQLPKCNGTILIDDHEARFADPDAIDFPDEVARLSEIKTAFVPRDVSVGAPPLITAEEVETPFGKVPISMEVGPNEMFIMTGPNGSGKTSFGRAMLGRLRLTNGKFIFADGVRPCMAFQNPEHCLFSNSVDEEVPDLEALRLCGLTEAVWKTNPLSLPRSKQKLISIVAACEMSRRAVILDEPTIGLDFRDQLKLQEILGRYKDRSFIIFTHDESFFQLSKYPGVKFLDISRRSP